MIPGFSVHTVRRATIDDLPTLARLWREAMLPVAELEKRFIEFQVAVNAEGHLLAAVGLRIQGTQGWVFGEVFLRPEWEDEYRTAIWERLHRVAQNFGLARLWTLEPAPFWGQQGFAPATPEERGRLPEKFGDPLQKWRTLKLKEETAVGPEFEKEFTLFMEAQKADTARVMQQAQFLKHAMLVLALIFVIVLLGAALFVVFRGVLSGPR